MKERNYLALLDDGHDYHEFRYTSPHRNGSKENLADCKQQFRMNHHSSYKYIDWDSAYTQLEESPLTYEEMKEEARQEAIDWQYEIAENSIQLSWGECAYWSDYFTRKAKRYGLLKEFRENGII